MIIPTTSHNLHGLTLLEPWKTFIVWLRTSLDNPKPQKRLWSVVGIVLISECSLGLYFLEWLGLFKTNPRSARSLHFMWKSTVQLSLVYFSRPKTVHRSSISMVNWLQFGSSIYHFCLKRSTNTLQWWAFVWFLSLMMERVTLTLEDLTPCRLSRTTHPFHK